MSGEPAVFALNSSREFGTSVSNRLGVPLGTHEEREFEDGECKVRPLQSVRGRDVFAIQSLYGDEEQSVNDKLCRFLFFLGALRDASAGSVTAVIPYLCYARKDRRSKPRDPLTTRYVAAMFEAMGVDRALMLDVHNVAAIENAWRIPIDHLEARALFVNHFVPIVANRDVVAVSPDAGGVKRVEEFRQALSKALKRDVQNAFVEKYRSAGVISGHAVVGDVRGKTAVILDDLISSGGTMVRAAEACRARGAVAVYAAATHGVFGKGASAALTSAALDGVVVTNSIPYKEKIGRVTVLDVVGLIAEAIRRIHSGGSLLEMREGI